MGRHSVVGRRSPSSFGVKVRFHPRYQNRAFVDDWSRLFRVDALSVAPRVCRCLEMEVCQLM